LELVEAEPIVPDAIMVESAKTSKPRPCVVCGETCSPNSTEGLCWVCRRLKLSAWRDADTQMPAQE
jgi:hypothetical protein